MNNNYKGVSFALIEGNLSDTFNKMEHDGSKFAANEDDGMYIEDKKEDDE